MKAGDRVVLIKELNTFEAFPPKYQDSKRRTHDSGESGVIEEVYESGGGIVDFDGKRVLIWDLNDNLKKDVTA